jgi:hypothetical protein
MSRKISKFHVCDHHAGLFAGVGRYRMAEVFVEGGPAGAAPCDQADPCRLWPGTDIFCASICDSEMALDWGHPATCRGCDAPLSTGYEYCEPCRHAGLDDWYESHRATVNAGATS